MTPAGVLGSVSSLKGLEVTAASVPPIPHGQRHYTVASGDGIPSVWYRCVVSNPWGRWSEGIVRCSSEEPSRVSERTGSAPLVGGLPGAQPFEDSAGRKHVGVGIAAANTLHTDW